MSSEYAKDVLRTTTSSLQTYLKEVSPEDLNRCDQNRAALVGAVDHVRYCTAPAPPPPTKIIIIIK